MNVLILSNPARGYYKFFNAIAKHFESDGHRVTMAVDCEYSAYINRLVELDIPYHVFSTFFAKHDHDRVILDEYSEYNLNSALLSDFERAETIDLWGRRENFFFDSLKSALLSFFEGIIRDHRIDYVIFENASDCFSHFALFVCQKHKAKYCGITSSRLPGRFTLTEKPWEEHVAIDRNLKKLEQGSLDLTDEAKQWCKDYIDNIGNTKPDYMAFNGLDNLGFLVGSQTDDKARVIWGAFRFMFGEHDFAFKIGNPLIKRWKMFRRALERSLRARALARYYSEPDLKQDFLLYPLHYHPESSTSILAGTYLDEYEVIRNIAFNLPEGVRLYVKDHKSAFGFPRRSFYESVVRLPNVSLLHPSESIDALIRASLAVITLTSTAGYEALLSGKRVFIYGRTFYESHPDAIRVSNPASLFDLFRQWLREPVVADRDFNIRFVQAYFASTLPGVLNIAGPAAPDLARDVYPHILQALSLQGTYGSVYGLPG